MSELGSIGDRVLAKFGLKKELTDAKKEARIQEYLKRLEKDLAPRRTFSEGPPTDNPDQNDANSHS